jgi:acetyl-CoA carboxylase carboxyltransferase component
VNYEKAGFDRIESSEPKENPEEIFGIIPASRAEQYDTYEIIKRLVDNQNSKNINQIMAKRLFVYCKN